MNFGLPTIFVTYTTVQKAGDLETTVMDNLPMFTTQQSKVEAEPSYGVYKRFHSSFKIDPSDWAAVVAAAHLPDTVIPKSQDTFVDDADVTWQVCGKVDSPPASHPWALWRLTADRLEIELELDDQVTLLQATAAASATGERRVTDTADADFTDIPAAIEPREQRIGEMFGTIVDPEFFDVYLDSDPSPEGAPSIIKVGDMLQDQNSVLYEIVAVDKRERLDLKPHFLVVKKL